MHLFKENWKPCEVLIADSSRFNVGHTEQSPLLHINRYDYDSCLYALSFHDILSVTVI